METNLENPGNIEIFKLAPGDIDHLFRRSGLSGNSLSAFRYNPEQAATSSPSEWFKNLSENVNCNMIARKLLQPDLKIEFHSGGAGSVEDRNYALLSSDNQGVLQQMVDSEGNLLLLLFTDRGKFLEWWTSTYASPGMADYKTVFPGIMETEVLVCALHCVDVYRRSYMESMLDYRGDLNLSLRLQDFVQLLERSLASGDKRWLLPTMFEITPGLKNTSIALKPEHMKKVEELGFIASNDDIITLSERSMLMGTEFISGWMGSMGLQATVLINGQERSLSRVYLAPTAFANHLVSFETGPGGESRCRHQARTSSQLVTSLEDWMNALQKAAGQADAPATQATPAPAAPAAARPRFCGQCGSEIRPGKKFCTQCGSPI